MPPGAAPTALRALRVAPAPVGAESSHLSAQVTRSHMHSPPKGLLSSYCVPGAMPWTRMAERARTDLSLSSAAHGDTGKPAWGWLSALGRGALPHPPEGPRFLHQSSRGAGGDHTGSCFQFRDAVNWSNLKQDFLEHVIPFVS